MFDEVGADAAVAFAGDGGFPVKGEGAAVFENGAEREGEAGTSDGLQTGMRGQKLVAECL